MSHTPKRSDSLAPEAHSSHKSSSLEEKFIPPGGVAPEAHSKSLLSKTLHERRSDTNARTPKNSKGAAVSPAEGVLDLSVKKPSNKVKSRDHDVKSRDPNSKSRRASPTKLTSPGRQLTSPQRCASTSSHGSHHSPRGAVGGSRELERGEISADVSSDYERQRALADKQIELANKHAELLASAFHQNLTDSYYAQMLGSMAFMPPMFDTNSGLLVPPTPPEAPARGRGRNRGGRGGTRKARSQPENGETSPSPPQRTPGNRGRSRGGGGGGSARSSRGRGRAKNVESRSLAELAMEVSLIHRHQFVQASRRLVEKILLSPKPPGYALCFDATFG